MLGGLLLYPCSNSAHIGRTSDVCLGGLLLAPVLIVHILAEHLMYACGRTSDVCLVGYYLPLF